ncbi:MAG: NADH-quinone oxidoreductase subunit N [Nitrospira sp.]|nr:NADH-quinone oxidoreductase subunit N [Nitrospira sp.]
MHASRSLPFYPVSSPWRHYPGLPRWLHEAVTTLLVVDGHALLYMGLVLTATMVIIALSYRYLNFQFREREGVEEYYLLLLLATFGGLVLTTAAHFVSFFLGFELLGLSLCSLIGYLRTRRHPLEAAVKYLLLSITASALLLFGLALLYFESGAMTFHDVGAIVKQAQSVPALWLGGLILVLVGIALKLGLAPFHMWVPDVYQGAPTPITAYLATVSKAAVVALLLRFATEVGLLDLPPVVHLFSLLAVVSMVTGNVLALLQENVKRLLAYSSIAHFGYVLVALLAGGPPAAEAVTFYVIVYCAMSLGAFGVVTVYSSEGGDKNRFEDYQGLVLDATLARWHVGTEPAVVGRYSSDGGIHRKVLCDCGRRRCRPVVAGAGADREQRRQSLLLSSTHRDPVQ